MPVGLPYNNNNPRPVKNGQPPPCIGQCNLGIGTRKVGAAMKRLPQLYYGDKAKEQILQKWDPVSKRLVNIHDNGPIITMLNDWNLNYNVLSALWSQYKGLSVELQIFTNTTNSIEGATPVLSAIVLPGNQNINTYVTNYTSVFRNFYFFTIRPINYTVSPTRSAVYQLNWYVNGWVPESVGGVSSILVRGIAIDDAGNTYSSDVGADRIIKTTSSGVSTVLLTVTDPLGLAVNSNILYITNSSDTIRQYNLTTSSLLSDITFPSGSQLRALTFDSQNNMYAQSVGSIIYKRAFQDGTITTILLDTSGLPGTSMGYYRDALNNEYIYYTNTSTFVVDRTLVLQNGVVPATFVTERVAGTGVNGYSGDGRSALQATLKAARGVAVDTLGNVIVMDNENDAIRYIPASTGIIHTICGTGVQGTGTNGVVGTSSQVNKPWAVIFKDPSTAYFTDSENKVTRVLNLTGHY
jgi:hypothetical protein